MHIPKTSGIAVAWALIDAVKPQRTYFGFDRAYFGAFDAFDTIAPETRAFIHFSPYTLPPSEAVIRAHMALSTLRAAYPQGRFMTVLREPVCRLLSHYLFWRGFTPAQLDPWGAWADYSRIAEQPLAVFLTDPRIACQTDNVATRLLLWPNAAIPPGNFIDPAYDAGLIAQARAALDTLHFADLTENPAFTANLAAFLGTPPRPLARHNETPRLPPHLRMPAAAALSSAALDALRARTRLDNALWHDRAAALGIAEPACLAEDARLQGTAHFADLLNAGVVM